MIWLGGSYELIILNIERLGQIFELLRIYVTEFLGVDLKIIDNKYILNNLLISLPFAFLLDFIFFNHVHQFRLKKLLNDLLS